MRRFNKVLAALLVLVCCVLVIAAFVLLDGREEDKQTGLQEYQADVGQIASLRRSLQPGPTNDLETYERFAEAMMSKWSERPKEYYARMINELCGPLSSGRFDEDRQHIVAREYAMQALAEADAIPLETELELTGHVVTYMGRRRPEAEQWVRIRREDVEVRLHAWKRLLDTIDPTWDPNERLVAKVEPPVELGLPPGVAPEAIKDPKLRAEYQAAIERNRQKIERYTEQHRLRLRLKTFPKTTEDYIVQAYSTPPYNTDELKESLERYGIEEQTGLRILDAVSKNIEQQTKSESG